MIDKKKLFEMLPATREYFSTWLPAVLDNVNGGESVQLAHLPYTGATALMKFFLECGEMVVDNWQERYGQKKWLWLDLEKEIFEVADLREGEIYLEKEVTAKIKEWSWNEQKQVVVVIDEAARLLDGKPEWRKGLYDWWRINPMKISFIYIVVREVEPEVTKKKLGYLWTSFWQGRVWMPLQNGESLNNMIVNQKRWHGIKISDKEVEQIGRVWGGWPCMARL